MTTAVHAYATEALGLSSPPWAYAGEFLNPDRSVLAGGAPGNRGGGRAYLTPNGAPARFAAAAALCARLLTPQGECYKDVVQPFVVAGHIHGEQRDRRNDGGAPAAPAVLVVNRDVTQVAAAMLARGWDYPRTAARQPGSAERQVVEGLLRADAVLRTLPGVTVDAAEILADPGCLAAALQQLYPTRRPLPRWDLKLPPPGVRPAAVSDDLRSLVDNVRSSLGPRTSDGRPIREEQPHSMNPRRSR